MEDMCQMYTRTLVSSLNPKGRVFLFQVSCIPTSLYTSFLGLTPHPHPHPPTTLDITDIMCTFSSGLHVCTFPPPPPPLFFLCTLTPASSFEVMYTTVKHLIWRCCTQYCYTILHITSLYAVLYTITHMLYTQSITTLGAPPLSFSDLFAVANC